MKGKTNGQRKHKTTTYVIVRYGSNAANQSCCNRAVLGSVEIPGRTRAQRERHLQARLGSQGAGTLHAVSTFSQDGGGYWEAYSNQFFRWIEAARATAEDRESAVS